MVVRVHEDLLKAEAVDHTHGEDKSICHDRCRSIKDLEKHLHANGTHIVKFFLHSSKDEPRKQFLERIDDPEKSWKINMADMRERIFWNEYMKVCEKFLSATSTKDSPWFIVPADDKECARLIVSQIVLETFKDLMMSYPKTSKERRQELLAIREQLAT